MDRRLGRSGPTEEPRSYDAAFPSLGAPSASSRQRPDKQRKKITPTPTAATPVDSTFLLAQPSSGTDISFGQRGRDLFGRQAKPLEVDLRLLLKEKRGRQKGLVVQDAPLSEVSVKPFEAFAKVRSGRAGAAWGTSEDTNPVAARGLESRFETKGTNAWGQGVCRARESDSSSDPWGGREPLQGDVQGTISQGLHTPPQSGRPLPKGPNQMSGTVPSQTPAYDAHQNPASHAQTPSPHRQFLRATSPGISSPAGVSETPPTLSPPLQRAVEAHGEHLRRGGVSSLLRELQTIVELLTAQPTSCGETHGYCITGEAGKASGNDWESREPGVGVGDRMPQTDEIDRERRESSGVATSQLAGDRDTNGYRLRTANTDDRVEPANGLRAPFLVEADGDQIRNEDRILGTTAGRRRDTGDTGDAGRPVSEAPWTAGLLAFCCGDVAAAYACAVLERSQPLVLHCGEPVLNALLQEPAVSRHSQSLKTALQGALAAHQIASLRGLGSPQKGGVSKGGAPLSALPFDEEQDSRNIPAFKTQEGQRLFSNREESRDVFYRIIRDAATTSASFSSEPIPPSLKSGPHQRSATGSFSGSFPKPGFPRPENALGFPASVRQLLDHLHGSNYPWLAKLFVQQISQVASTGETDAEVRNLAREDTAKLQRLHSRLMGAGGAPLRLAAGGTPSPGRRFKALDASSPLVLSGGRGGSPGLEGMLRETRMKGRGAEETFVGERVGETVSTSKGKGARDQGQTVRRTLAEVFEKSKGGNAEGGRRSGVSVGSERRKEDFAEDGRPCHAWTQRPVSSTDSNVVPNAPLAPGTEPRKRLLVATSSNGPKQASSASLGWPDKSGEPFRTAPSVAGPAPHEPSFRAGPSNPASTQVASAKQPSSDWRTGLSVAVSRPQDPLSEDGPFGGLFSRSLLPYVRVLQAADSHRLHVLLTHCITNSIESLSRIGAGSAFSSSSFSERLVTLQTLARFLGFLLFAPVSIGHSALPTDPPSPVYTWSGELPLSLVDALKAAVSNGSLLLTLPWVLEVLGMMRACAPARKAPAFVGAVAEVGKLRGLPALVPSDPSFGLPSMCVTAALEGFFREDPLPPTKPSQILQSPSATWPPRDSPDSLPGLIDARYIQNCCPLLEDLAATLGEARRARQMGEMMSGPDGTTAGDRRTRPIRKITPTPPAQAVQPGALPADLLAALPKEDADLVRPPQRNPLKSKLEGVFFEQQPQLRRLVDFVVDSVAANSALAAQSATCADVIKGARAQILERAEKNATDFVGLSGFEVFVQQTILTACRESLPRAIAYARNFSQERVCEALRALARPNILAPILGTAAAVAAQASAVGAVKIVLANVPKEIRQRLLEDADKAKKKLVATMTNIERGKGKAALVHVERN